ncbi:peptidoglycan-binding protein [Kitasatospora sp. NBC_01287]|uniref:WXG100 family type VII secretion target n=1 Tax=Kitasatospora sp. NBC_01287 TaxID=2903573 RepID=UPI00224FBB1D|nr:peptidoglycan-binding protein [Kitasatospora sp. NBC_01287]MCX4745707.1 peptidoglycan-binding protein [Kitasatospora sp. NBC_01287]
MPDHDLHPLGSDAGTYREQVERLKHTIDDSHGMWGAGDLKYAVHDALQLTGPKGDPGKLDALAAAYGTASGQLDQTQQEVQRTASQRLPDAWTGQVGEKAVEVVTASSDDLTHCRDVLGSGRDQISALAGALRQAQVQHGQGAGPLQEALKLLHDITIAGAPDPVNWDDGKMHTAHAKAKDGIASIFGAAVAAETAGHTAARELNALADKALAGRFKNKGLGAVDKLVIADASVAGDAQLGTILTANDATRAGQFMDKMSDADRARFDQLLAGSKSPEERAYLMKALAAGHSYDEIKAFDDQIHDHGDDPSWLAERISPVQLDSTSGGQADTGYQGVEWSQGQHPTCVASSTVTARAMVDPLYALQLTTGGHPGDPKFDNGEAAQQRWLSESNRVYDERGWWHSWSDGMTTGESKDVANGEIAAHTGASYQTKDLGSADARRDSLGQIEQSVDEGKPVPLGVKENTWLMPDGHQMMIIGHRGDQLEIYNPWGFTAWVSENDFVNNNLGSLTQNELPNVNYVQLPK